MLKENGSLLALNFRIGYLQRIFKNTGADVLCKMKLKFPARQFPEDSSNKALTKNFTLILKWRNREIIQLFFTNIRQLGKKDIKSFPLPHFASEKF